MCAYVNTGWNWGGTGRGTIVYVPPQFYFGGGTVPPCINVCMCVKKNRPFFFSFLALACDSFAMKNLTDKNYASEDWTTIIPNFDELGPLPSSVSNPPFLPPHLSHNILNKKDFEAAKYSSSSTHHADSTILPEPMSHVMLHHLYAQSIRDHLLVFASTERYRKKCVTIIYYRPIDWYFR